MAPHLLECVELSSVKSFSHEVTLKECLLPTKTVLVSINLGVALR